MRPMTQGILESSLYVSDLARSIQFYESIFGFRVISDFGGRGMRARSRQPTGAFAFQEGRFP